MFVTADKAGPKLVPRSGVNESSSRRKPRENACYDNTRGEGVTVYACTMVARGAEGLEYFVRRALCGSIAGVTTCTSGCNARNCMSRRFADDFPKIETRGRTSRRKRMMFDAREFTQRADASARLSRLKSCHLYLLSPFQDTLLSFSSRITQARRECIHSHSAETTIARPRMR